MDEISVRMTEIDARSKSNSHRIDKLESATRAVNDLAVSVKLLAAKQLDVVEKVDKIDGKVSEIELKPAKRWDGIIDRAIILAVTAVVTFALTKFGL